MGDSDSMDMNMEHGHDSTYMNNCLLKFHSPSFALSPLSVLTRAPPLTHRHHQLHLVVEGGGRASGHPTIFSEIDK